ncbi:DUF4862 domain-containing protein [Corynebacterium sp. 13CS0277]|uniref:DUF4862 family protein n=1 Tax=Corynebacterium sp. 13CS0277 TaxID=2071994 RepID=UPI000D03D360|nr:DUF4862 family protein [Corynebacterium sp. 13CS0277]PRQ12235.1 DUF4862 domain-containing protein [Corynebacterium sp. 13CS0277]
MPSAKDHVSPAARAALPFIVGAYASQPQDAAGQAEYYDLLAATGWVDGLEVPFPGQLRDPATRYHLGELMAGRFTHSVLTPIPGTMMSVWDDPTFGLASPHPSGRARAVEFLREAHDAVASLHADHGPVFRWVALHSAPTNTCDPEAFATSVAEIAAWDWGGVELVIEHCDETTATTDAAGISPDRVRRTHTPEKGFLLLGDEIAIAQEYGVGVSLNWGRSAVGSRGATVPAEHVAQAAAAGVLRGVLFSGASPEATTYGSAWLDGHLPATTDEPASIMSEQLIDAAASRAVGADYLGAKCCVPADAPLARRVEMLSHIHRAAIGAPGAGACAAGVGAADGAAES